MAIVDERISEASIVCYDPFNETIIFLSKKEIEYSKRERKRERDF